MKKIFTGLFNNWDSVANISNLETKRWDKKYIRILDEATSLKDSEILISKDEYDYLASRTRKRSRFLGGNGGNAATALAEAGIDVVMSAPSRSSEMLHLLSAKGIHVAEGNRVMIAEDAKPNEVEYEHICIENDNFRHIFTYDPLSEGLVIDYDFFTNLRKADMLWISGFHLVSEKGKKNIDEVSDLLEGRNFPVHLEVGRGGGLMEYALRKFTSKGIINSIGFTDTEISYLGIDPANVDVKSGLESISEKFGIEKVTLHTNRFVSTYIKNLSKKAIESAKKSVDLAAAKSYGIITTQTQREAKFLPFHNQKEIIEKDFFIIPARMNKKPQKITGLGDTFSALEFFHTYA